MTPFCCFLCLMYVHLNQYIQHCPTQNSPTLYIFRILCGNPDIVILSCGQDQSWQIPGNSKFTFSLTYLSSPPPHCAIIFVMLEKTKVSSLALNCFTALAVCFQVVAQVFHYKKHNFFSFTLLPFLKKKSY